MTMANNRRPAFELLGGKYVEATSAQAAASQAGLDWSVSLQPISANYPIFDDNGDQHVLNLGINDKWATVKTPPIGDPTVLGIVGSRYGVVQNSDMFSSLDCLVDSGDARFTAAGELDGGRQVYMVMELPKDIKVKGDPHAGYLLARTSHDGSTAMQITTTVNRLFCTNQINSTIYKNRKGGLGVYSLRHTINAEINISEIRKVIDVVYADIDDYVSMSNHLLNIEMSDEEVKNFFQNVWSLPTVTEAMPYDLLSQGEKRARTIAHNARSSAFNIYSGSTGTQEALHGTAFGAFQAVVEWADWFSSDNETLRAERTMLGSSDDIKRKALVSLGTVK